MTTETRTPAIDATITGSVLTLAFSNGETLVLDTENGRLTSDIQNMARMHGFKQKLVDAAAISRNPDTGRSATIEDKYNAVREVFDRLMSGQWNKVRTDGASTKGGLLFRALCLMYPDKTPDAIRAFLDKKTPAEKTALRNTAKIADIILQFKADDNDPEWGDKLLDELDATPYTPGKTNL